MINSSGSIRFGISPKTSIWIINTENTGSGASTETDEYSYKIPTDASGQYNFTVDWGDGTIDTITSYNQPEVTHTYTTKGEKTIYITGQCDRLWWSGVDRDKIIDITRWGEITTNIQSAFQNCENFIGSATDLQNRNFIQTGTSMQDMFSGCSVFNGKIGRVPGLTSMTSTFLNCFTFNQPLNHLDVSGITNFEFTFQGCTSFNQPLNLWDVSNASQLRYILYNATSFNQPLDKWKPVSCSNFRAMFQNATSFDQDLSSWSSSFQASNIDMEGMFFSCANFNNGGSPNINNWDVSNVTNFRDVFYNCDKFNQPLDNWDVSNGTSIQSMFANCQIFNQNINSWDTSNISNMGAVFYIAQAFNQPLNNWDVSNSTTFNYMLSVTSFNQPLDQWKPISGSSFVNMFASNRVFNQDLSAWSSSFQASNINMTNMFDNAQAFNQSLGSWQIENITNMTNMLNNCGMSRENYEDTLISWSLQAPSLQSGVNLGATNLEYSGSDATVSSSRAVLINDYGWTISGDINVG